MKGTRKLVDALETMVRDYRKTAAESLGFAEGKIYIPTESNFMEDSLLRLIDHPGQLETKDSKGTEPAYISLKEANKGRTTEGEVHGGYIVIDVLGREVVDLVDREGKSKFNMPKTTHLNGHEFRGDIDLLSSGIGSFAIYGGHRNFYSNLRCRCPCLDVDVFASGEEAGKKLDEIKNDKYHKDDNYRVVEITPEFIQSYKKTNRGVR